MTAEKTWLERYDDERIREHEDLRELKRAAREAGHRCVAAERVRESEQRARSSYAASRAEQRYERDILVSATALAAAVGAQTTAAPAQGREPLRAASGLLRRSAGVGWPVKMGSVHKERPKLRGDRVAPDNWPPDYQI